MGFLHLPVAFRPDTPSSTARAARRRLGAAALCVALALLAAPMAARAQPAAAWGGEVPVGQPLRDATMRGLNGPARKLSAYRGRPLLINVWASWCGPCRQEMASLERLAWKEHAVPFTVIGISTDDDPQQAQALLRSTRATLSHFIDRELALETMLGASRLPLTVFVDAQGRVIDKVYGAKQWDGPEAAALIAAAFAKPSRPAAAARQR